MVRHSHGCRPSVKSPGRSSSLQYRRPLWTGAQLGRYHCPPEDDVHVEARSTTVPSVTDPFSSIPLWSEKTHGRHQSYHPRREVESRSRPGLVHVKRLYWPRITGRQTFCKVEGMRNLFEMSIMWEVLRERLERR